MPKHDGIWRWGFGGIRFTLGHEGETLMIELVFLQEEGREKSSGPLSARRGHREKSACQEENSHKEQT